MQDLGDIGGVLDGSHSHQECLVDGVALGGYDVVSYRSDRRPYIRRRNLL